MSEKYLHEMIDDIEVLIDEAKPARFNPGKIVIDKDVLMTVIEELRKQIPGEVERSHKIINQAAAEAGTLIDENEIVEMAKMRADEIEGSASGHAQAVIRSANEEADQIRIGALQYTKEIMEDVQGYVSSVIEAQQSVFGQLMDTLNSDLDSISANAREIEEQLTGVSQPKARTVEDFISKDE